jgi:uncharacterized protein YjiS (DUF1127 family)
VRRKAIVVLARLRRVVNTWVAEALAYRERQAALHALLQYDDRELRDIGLYRGQIEQSSAMHRTGGCGAGPGADGFPLRVTQKIEHVHEHANWGRRSARFYIRLARRRKVSL